MSIYVVTGGSKGIGATVVEILRGWGNEVVNVDIADADISGDLGTAEGRKAIIDEVHARYPDGIDGLVANAGISGVGVSKPSRVLSVNYFGAVAVIEGLYDLLEKRRGNCVVTSSFSISYTEINRYFVHELLLNCGDEERICQFVDSLEPDKISSNIYVSSKIALTRYVRRVSGSWATHGMRINAVAPGGVDTTIIPNMKEPESFSRFSLAFPMPAVYRQEDLLRPEDLGRVLSFMVTKESRGINGALIYCDGGAHGLLNTERI